jgi:hypothetical protein
VDEGLPALAAFRRFYRDAVMARQDGVAMLAVLGRGCYGGASLLAILAEHRIYSPQTRLSTSGQGIIESVEGKERFDARNAEMVTALLGTHARLKFDDHANCVDDAGLRTAVGSWLAGRSGPRDRQAQHALLKARMTATTDITECRARLQALLPQGYEAQQRGNIVYALPMPGSAKATFVGYLAGKVFGAADAWCFADLLREIGVTHPGTAVVLLLDAGGHAARIADEEIILADYLVHLCLCVADLSARGHKTALWIPGAASGAVYVVFSSPVDHVSVLPTCKVEILGSQAVDRILGHAVASASSVQELVDLGIADAVLDSRLERYPAR